MSSIILLSFVFITNASAQSTGTIQGTITDQNGAAIANARIIVRSSEKNIERVTQTAITGNYQIASLPTGTYQIEVQAQGFSTQKAANLILEVSKIAVQNFQLRVGEVAQEVNITAESQLIESATTTVGQVINQKTVQEIPLNGRHFVDLGLLIPGSVTPPQSGFLSTPTRGQGAFAFNTAGAREDTVNFMINGINLNDMVQNQITFQPSINTVQEFKADNSTYSAEYGRNSGAIVNIATRSGTNQFHGEVFNFLRNDVFDARNFFDKTGKPPFKRNQFGAALGGPLYLPVIDGKDKTFFFFSYEGLRQRQGLTLSNGVLSDTQRAGITDPIIRRLVEDFVPRANAIDANGRSLFVGSATAPVNIDQWTIDINRNLGTNDLLHAYYAIQRDTRGEPTLQNNTIPGFGDTRVSRRQIFTLNETHTFGPRTVSETRFGFNRIRITFTPNNQINPLSYGIQNGVNEPIGLPQLVVTGLGLNFGGPVGFPQGRADTTAVVSNTISHQQGRHSFKFGGEFRRFYNNNFTKDTGTFVFADVNEFMKGNSSSFNIVLGERNRSFGTGALGFFIQDGFKVKTNLTFELGFRYDWNQTPSERFDRMVVFDSHTVSLVQLGSDRDLVYKQNNKNFQPRIGFIWDPFKNGKTSIRAAYAILTDQPVTNMLAGPGANPPLANPLTFTGITKLSNAFISATAAGLSPTSIDPNFDNAYVQSWNLNIQREITSTLGMQIGYFGSKGTHLRISRNMNQGSSAIRPFIRLSANSPILPNQLIRNITEITSAGNSSYNALWASVNKRLSQGLQFNANYAWSKSIDYNSLNSQGVVVQDSFNLRNNRGLSDFDTRHRLVFSALYELPFKGNRLVEGWQISTITQLQSGNPINIVTNIQAITGVLNTGRPNLNGEIQIIGKPEQWFSATAFTLTGGFGDLGRNVVIGPSFKNIDFSIMKKTKLTESLRMEVRTEIFDLFNHANFGQPGGLAAPGSKTFGVIQSTRFPTGDSGSSRQLQFALKLVF